jgi:hypothetical protein
MSGEDEKNIHVREGQKERDPYGSPGRVPGSRDGWTIGFGGSGGGRGEGGRPGTLSGSKRRRLRQEDKRRREQEARQKAEADRQAQVDAAAQAEQAAQAQRDAAALAAAEAQAAAEAHARAQAEAHARAAAAAAEARVKAEREREIAAHRHALETLPNLQAVAKTELDQKHIDALAALPKTLAAETHLAYDVNGLNGQSTLDAIIQEKAHINYLISQRSELSNYKHQIAYSFAGDDPLSITGEQYKAILASRSANAEQAHHVHRAWTQAYKDALEANLHTRASEHLDQLSQTLTHRYAEQANSFDQKSDRAAVKHLAEANRFWSVVAGPTAPSLELPSIGEKAKALAEKLFTQQASKLLGQHYPVWYYCTQQR